MLSRLQGAIQDVAKAVSRQGGQPTVGTPGHADPDPVVGQLAADHETWHKAVKDVFEASTSARSSLRQFISDNHRLARSLQRLDTLALQDPSRGHTKQLERMQQILTERGGQDALDAMDWGLIRPIHRAELGLAQLSARLRRRQQVRRELDHWSEQLASLQRSASSSAHRFARGIQQRLASGFSALTSRGDAEPGAASNGALPRPSVAARGSGSAFAAGNGKGTFDTGASRQHMGGTDSGAAGGGRIGGSSGASGFGRMDAPVAAAGAEQAEVVERLAAAQAEYDAITAAMRSELVRWRQSRGALSSQASLRGSMAVGLLLQEAGEQAGGVVGATESGGGEAASGGSKGGLGVGAGAAGRALRAIARADRSNFVAWTGVDSGGRPSSRSPALGSAKGGGARSSPALGISSSAVPDLPPLRLSASASQRAVDARAAPELTACPGIPDAAKCLETKIAWWEAGAAEGSAPRPSAPPATPSTASMAEQAPGRAMPEPSAPAAEIVGSPPAASGLADAVGVAEGDRSAGRQGYVAVRPSSGAGQPGGGGGRPIGAGRGIRRVQIRRAVPTAAFAHARVVPSPDGPECTTFEASMRSGQVLALNFVLLDQTLVLDRLGEQWLVSRLDNRNRWSKRKTDAMLAGDAHETAMLEVRERVRRNFSLDVARSPAATARGTETKDLPGLLASSAGWVEHLASYLDVVDLSHLQQSSKKLHNVVSASSRPWLSSCWSGGVPGRIRSRFWSWVTGSSPELGPPPSWAVAASGVAMELVRSGGDDVGRSRGTEDTADAGTGTSGSRYVPCSPSEYGALWQIGVAELQEAGASRAEWADLIEQDVLRTYFQDTATAGTRMASGGGASVAATADVCSPSAYPTTPPRSPAVAAALTSPVLEQGMQALSRSLQVPVTAIQLERGIRSSIVASRSGTAAAPVAAVEIGSKAGAVPEAAADACATPVDRRARLRARLTRLLYSCAQAFPCRYCQGMNYLGAMLLVQCNAEGSEVVGASERDDGGRGGALAGGGGGKGEPGTGAAEASSDGPAASWSDVPATAGEVLAFNLMRQLFDKRGMEGLFSRDMRAVGTLLFALEHVLWRLLPDAQAAMKRAGISPAMFATGWVMTLMSNERAIPLSMSPRVWDAFLVGGWPELLRSVVAVVASARAQVISGSIVRAGAGPSSDGDAFGSDAGATRVAALGSSSRTDDDAMSKLLPFLMSPRKYEPLCADTNGQLWLRNVLAFPVDSRLIEEATRASGLG